MQICFSRFVFALICLLPLQVMSQGFGRQRQDSSMVALQDWRRQIKFFADTQDYDTIAVIRQQLSRDFDSTRYMTFTEDEHLIINFMVRDYKKLVKEVVNPSQSENFNDFMEYPPEDGLFDHLLDVAILDSSQLLTNIETAPLKTRDQAFLKLYLRALLSLNFNSENSEKQLNSLSQRYLDQHAPSPYDRFIKTRLRRQYVKNDWSGTIGLGVARGTFQGDFGDLVRFHLPVLIDIEANYKHLVGGLRIASGEGTVRRSFEYEGFWDRGLRVSPFYGGLYAGYSVELMPFRITPYYDLGVTVMSVVERDLTVDTEGLELTGFTHGPGLSLDFMSPISWEGFYDEKYRLGLRFKSGILFNNLDNKDAMFESRYPYVGIELILDYVGTVLDMK